MTDQGYTASEEDDDLLAAEYVLGLLEGAAWHEAQDRAAIDGAFAARVQAWEERLSPLNAEFPEAPAPDLLPRIEAELFADPKKTSRRGWLWGLGLGTVAALVFVVAFFVATPPVPPTGPVLVAELVDEARGLRLRAAYSEASETLDLVLSGPAADSGQDYELWVIDATGQPRSLGLLTLESRQLRASLAEGQILAISVEPEGGSPEPAPTGPVLATAVLEAT